MELARPVIRPDLGNRRGIGVGAFLLALATAGALSHVAVRMKGIEVAYDLGRERRINKELEEHRRRLNIEIGMLKDPVRVVGIARDKLGMGPPPPSAIVDIAHLQAASTLSPSSSPSSSSSSSSSRKPRPAKEPR